MASDLRWKDTHHEWTVIANAVITLPIRTHNGRGSTHVCARRNSAPGIYRWHRRTKCISPPGRGMMAMQSLGPRANPHLPEERMAKKKQAIETVYKVVEVIGTSPNSWEDAA